MSEVLLDAPPASALAIYAHPDDPGDLLWGHPRLLGRRRAARCTS